MTQEAIARRAAKDITKGYDIQLRIEMAIKEALAQRTWVGLTDDEVDDIANSILTDDPVLWWRKLSQSIEAKLKEKNT
jgi:hypothetical protein